MPDVDLRVGLRVPVVGEHLAVGREIDLIGHRADLHVLRPVDGVARVIHQRGADVLHRVDVRRPDRDQVLEVIEPILRHRRAIRFGVDPAKLLEQLGVKLPLAVGWDVLFDCHLTYRCCTGQELPASGTSDTPAMRGPCTSARTSPLPPAPAPRILARGRGRTSPAPGTESATAPPSGYRPADWE